MLPFLLNTSKLKMGNLANIVEMGQLKLKVSFHVGFELVSIFKFLKANLSEERE